jgi:RNA 2',3'-cyclic 3'-phosphodiesterase
MRLFVAIALPAQATGDLDEVVSPLRPAWPALRWTRREAWHLTLAFLGEVDEPTAARLPRRLERAAARHGPLSLSLGGAGAFPSPLRARVLWTGDRGDRHRLEALARTVAGGARKAGVALPPEGRGFQPHLTLARCRVPADVRPVLESLAGYAGTPWVAGEIHLIRSHLGAQARYETLGAWELRAPGQRLLPGPAGPVSCQL